MLIDVDFAKRVQLEPAATMGNGLDGKGGSGRPDDCCEEVRCMCGSLLARIVPGGVELACRRCKRKTVIPLEPSDSASHAILAELPFRTPCSWSGRKNPPPEDRALSL